MSDNVHLVVENGPQKGTQLAIPPEGGRLGRSSRNDVVLTDPLLSRHHCRFFFKDDSTLAVADLGSANQTLVNGHPVQESVLNPGDMIGVGDTVVRVLDNTRAGGPPAAPVAATAVDLGLSNPQPKKEHQKVHLGPLLLACAAVAAVLLGFALLQNLSKPGPRRRAAQPAVQAPEVLEIAYEKIHATTQNIFRYELTLKDSGVMAVVIDDLLHDRHQEKQKKVDPHLLADLVRTIENSRFFDLDESYQGLHPSVYDSFDLCITIGHRTHRAQVKNRVEPPTFRELRERLEVFGKNELGLWAMQFSTEQLLKMAQEARLLGRKHYDEREVKHGNLAEAIRNLNKVRINLDTVDPKPDYYNEAMALLHRCEGELEKRYNDQNFRAEHAMQLSEWSKAAAELRILLEMIQNRSDPRNQEARRKLLEAESREKARE